MSIAEKLDKTRYIDVKHSSGNGWEPLHKWNQNSDVNKRVILHRDDLEAPFLNLHKLKSVKLMISLQKCSHAQFYFLRDYHNAEGETILNNVIMEFKIKEIDPVQNLLHAILEQTSVGEIADYNIRFWSYQSKFICNQIYQTYKNKNNDQASKQKFSKSPKYTNTNDQTRCICKFYMRMRIHVLRADDQLALVEQSPLKHLERQLEKLPIIRRLTKENNLCWGDKTFFKTIREINKFVQMAANKKEVD